MVKIGEEKTCLFVSKKNQVYLYVCICCPLPALFGKQGPLHRKVYHNIFAPCCDFSINRSFRDNSCILFHSDCKSNNPELGGMACMRCRHYAKNVVIGPSMSAFALRGKSRCRCMLACIPRTPHVLLQCVPAGDSNITIVC